MTTRRWRDRILLVRKNYRKQQPSTEVLQGQGHGRYESVDFYSSRRERGKTQLGRGRLMTAKILLVEDNEMNRDMLARRLQRKGVSVISAQTGEEGILLARAE